MKIYFPLIQPWVHFVTSSTILCVFKSLIFEILPPSHPGTYTIFFMLLVIVNILFYTWMVMFMCLAHRFPIFDGLGSLLRENIYVVCDNILMIFSYYVIFVCYYFPPSFIVINDNFHFKPFVGYYLCLSNRANLCWQKYIYNFSHIIIHF